MTSESKSPVFKSIGDAPKSMYTGVPGWLTEPEQGVLLTLAQGLSYSDHNSIIVEIGSENGQSASIFAKYSPMANIVCIDIDENAPFEYNLAQLDLFVDAIYGNSAELYWHNIVQSLNYKQGQGDIDLLFIDGDHSVKGVEGDLKTYAPYIRVGGFLLLHDCACETNEIPHAQHKDVSFALNKWLITDGYTLGFKQLFSVDSLMVFRRF